MFGRSRLEKQILENLREIEKQMIELKKNDLELKTQNARLHQLVRNLGRKLVSRLPISIESLEKGLDYDLIFSEEIETWRASVSGGFLLDARPAHEHQKGSIPGSYNIPLDQLAARIESLPKDRAILLICENGIKSVAACELLSAKGYPFLYVLKGGMSLYRGPQVTPAVTQPVEESTSAVSAV